MGEADLDTGTINFTGTIEEGSCKVETPVSSVNLGSQNTKTFGPGGHLHNFKIKLVDCPASVNKVLIKFSGKGDTGKVGMTFNQCPLGKNRIGCHSGEANASATFALKNAIGGHLWARGYFCATVGQLTEEMVNSIWNITLSQIYRIILK